MCCLGAAQGSETPGEADHFPSFPSQNGYTPLHQAAQQGHTHVINVLLQHGARPEATTAVRGRPSSVPRVAARPPTPPAASVSPAPLSFPENRPPGTCRAGQLQCCHFLPPVMLPALSGILTSSPPPETRPTQQSQLWPLAQGLPSLPRAGAGRRLSPPHL